MTTLRFEDLRQHSDVLRLRDGGALAVRFVEPDDAEALQVYFRSLSVRSRYNRFLGAMSELPQRELDHFIHVGSSYDAVPTEEGVVDLVLAGQRARVSGDCRAAALAPPDLHRDDALAPRGCLLSRLSEERRVAHSFKE